MTLRSLAGHRILVTGASSGIGRALAAELARAGADLILLARRREPLESLAVELRGQDRRVEIVTGDVAESDVRRAALALAEEKFGGLDGLVNNAGISAHGRFADAGAERLRQIMEVNFFAAAELIRAAVPILRRGRQPLIVNIGSILGHRGIPHNSEYVASKFALRGLSEAIRPELARVGIDLLLVSPGTTDTEFFDHLIEKSAEIPWTQRRGVSPEAVARATVRAMRRGRREIIPSLPGRALVWLNRLAPGLVDRLMKKYG